MESKRPRPGTQEDPVVTDEADVGKNMKNHLSCPALPVTTTSDRTEEHEEEDIDLNWWVQGMRRMKWVRRTQLPM